MGVDTRVLFTLIVALVAVDRLIEMLISRRNTRLSLARGGIVGEDPSYRWMVLLHTGLLLAAPAEVWGLSRPFMGNLALAMTLVVLSTAALRFWVMATLRERWNIGVICVPGLPPVTSGPYRWLRHPNYLAVMVEVMALPLIHGAWLTALVFGTAIALQLRVRIRIEEEVLSRHSDYSSRFAGRGRFLPSRP